MDIIVALNAGVYLTGRYAAVKPNGLAEVFVLNDLMVVGTLDGGGHLGEVDLVYVPEPSTAVLLAFGLLMVGPRVFHAKELTEPTSPASLTRAEV